MPATSYKKRGMPRPHKLFPTRRSVRAGAKYAVTKHGEYAEDVDPKSHPPPSVPDTPSDGKPGASCGIGTEDTKDGAQPVLGDPTQQEAICSSVEKRTLVTMPGILNIEDLLARIDALENQQTKHRTSVTTQREMLDSLRFRAAYHDGRLTNIVISPRRYKYRRNLFLSTFKREILGNASDTDLTIIGEGENPVEGGDALFDASLYSGVGARTDTSTFEKLYGLFPGSVGRLVHKETIKILNIHAGVISSKHKTGSDKFYRLFEEFVRAFEHTGDGYEEGYLNGNPTETTRAYWAFMGCVGDEVVDATISG